MKDFARTFYRSKQWQAAREEAIRRDQYLCQDCLKKGRITPAEEVHHITEVEFAIVAVCFKMKLEVFREFRGGFFILRGIFGF